MFLLLQYVIIERAIIKDYCVPARIFFYGVKYLNARLTRKIQYSLRDQCDNSRCNCTRRSYYTALRLLRYS